ncbi:MAG: alpha/beta hydrolase [Verrucomicrobia bacterium]|nr:alpha/beta hydrolase [Verrucomicrobiota bacterium]
MRPTLPALFALLLAIVSCHAADPGFTVEKDVAFLAPDRAEKLDVYLPATDGTELRPGFVWIHGGGWTGGTKNEARAANVCGTLARAGYVAVSVDYRLGDGAWPTLLFDCKNAVRFLRAQAARYRIDPARIAVGGGSAGGHLALMVALTAGQPGLEPEGGATPYPGVSSAVRCGVNLYGITNILTRRQVAADGTPGEIRPPEGAHLRVYSARDAADPVFRLASPVNHLSPASVPLLTLHGRRDATVDYLQAEELDRVARERGARHELVLLERAGHTFDLETWQRKPLERDLRPVLLEFLGRHLR